MAPMSPDQARDEGAGESAPDGGGGFTADERAAMRARAAEARTSRSRKGADKARAALQNLLNAVSALSGADRDIADFLVRALDERHPDLAPRTWYGMPAWEHKGKVLLFFQPGEKFKSRYPTLGFNDTAALDDGAMWATSFAITALTPEVEARVNELVDRAVASPDPSNS